MGIIVVQTSHDNKEDAEKMVNKLVRMKLIACGSIKPMESIYNWKGDIAIDGEHESIMRTISEKWEELKDYIEKNHPYEVPCIIKVEVECNSKCEKWIRECVQ